jgi:hypothetical protein
MSAEALRVSFVLHVEGPGCSTSEQAIAEHIARLVQNELPSSMRTGVMLTDADRFEVLAFGVDSETLGDLRAQACDGLDKLEAMVASGQCTLKFALTRAFQLGVAFAGDMRGAK